jgi:hypothetical protein
LKNKPPVSDETEGLFFYKG